MFKRTKHKFYLIAGLLLLLFCIGYVELAVFLKRLSGSSEKVQAAALINQEILESRGEFWRLRFWESMLQTEGHAEAEQQFGTTIESIRKRIAAFHPEPFADEFSGSITRISSLLSEYEDSFNRLIQSKTEQRLNQTRLVSNYQVLSSAILMSQDSDLLKPLLNLNRFLNRYLQTRKESEYQALHMVFGFLHTKLSQSEFIDSRMQSYLTKFDTLSKHDFNLEKEIRIIHQTVDDTSVELMAMFTELSHTADMLSNEAISTGTHLRSNIQRQFFLSVGIAFIALVGIVSIIARQIINPIRHMSDVIMQVKSGHDRARFASQGKDEIAELGFALNDMLDTIHQHRHRLEAVVEERTEKLITTNTQLQQEIAERKQTEIRLQHAKEAAEAANRAKSAFLANMSHELRTPLNAILGYAQILQRDPAATEFQSDRLHVIRQSGEHLLSLLSDILDLSKVEAGRMELRPTEFHFAGFLKMLTENIRIQAKQKELRFSYTPSPDLPVAVQGDEIRLRQVLINLLGNAVKYTEKGSITLRIAKSEIGNVKFEIEDTGPGIPPDEMDQIFSPFQQASQHVGTGTGTGLGLTITKRLVDLMGGELGVESTVGRGSTFWVEVSLPPVESWTEEIQPIHAPIIGYIGSRRTVLVVDDKSVNRAVLLDLLAPLGFEVVEADGGREGVAQATACHPDLIFMDLVMPDPDGFEATRQIRKAVSSIQYPVSSIQYRPVIVAISASVFDEDRQRSIDAGCDDFLSKPFKADEVLNTVRHHLGLEWIYAENAPMTEDAEEETSATMIAPPPDTVDVLLEFARLGDIGAIRHQAEELMQQDPQLKPFATELLQLAKGFHIDTIRTLLATYTGEER
ncbi:MAG: response regulator [bacterium]|nr:response regulator [bacterium]